MDSSSSVPRWSCSCSSSYRLVVAEGGVSEGDVVHAALGGGAVGESFENDVGHPLRCENVSPYNSSRVVGKENGAGGDGNSDWSEAALIEGDVFPYHGTQTVDNGRICDGTRGVAVAVDLSACACEVEVSRAIVDVNLHVENNRSPVVHRILSMQPHQLLLLHLPVHVPLPRGGGGGDASLSCLFEHVTDCKLSVGLDVMHVGEDKVKAELGYELIEQEDSLLVGCDLSSQV
mmetsp:Transcript_36027/g.112630  ORF Transcript_36027/g.112630 Transcript_36027/m.112630 type:complete len:232 (+) Transcript_36027:479-1174(+)